MIQRLTPVVLNIIILNVLVFLFVNLMVAKGQVEIVLHYFRLFKSDLVWDRPAWYLEFFHPVQLVSAFFTHIEFFHLLMNMLALVFLGTVLEMVMGAKRFLSLYLVSGLFSTVLTWMFDPSPIPVVGASGAISGLLVALAYYRPHDKIGLLFLPFRFKMKSFAIGFAAISAVLVAVQIINPETSLGGISHFGHLMGMVGGFVYMNMGKITSRFR